MHFNHAVHFSFTFPPMPLAMKSGEPEEKLVSKFFAEGEKLERRVKFLFLTPR